jgi:MFS family permease
MSAMGRGITRRLPASLRESAFRRYWTAATVSYLGDQVTFVALPLVAILALHSSAPQMGVLTALEWLPALLFSLHAGAFVDRRGRRRATMIATDCGRALALVSVPVAYWLDVLTLPWLYVVTFLAGSLSVLFNVSSNSLFVTLVGRERLVQATSLMRGSFSFSWVAGPSLGGVLVQLLSGPVALLVDVGSFLCSAALMGSVAPEEPPGSGEDGDIRGGLRFVAREPTLRVLFISAGLVNFFFTIYFTLLLLFAARVVGLSAAAIGLFIGGGAIGALFGSTVAGRLGRAAGLGPATIAGYTLYMGALVLSPLAVHDHAFAFVMLAAAEFFSGFGLVLGDICSTAIRQALTPDRLRSRVQGAYLVANNGSRPLGALAGGALGSWLGLRETLWVGIAGGLVGTLILLASPLARMRSLPDEAV